MLKTNDEFLFVEKYRPNKLEDCILPAKIKTEVASFIAAGQIPHMIFAGSAGTGKTTLAKAIANEIGADLLYVNASNESGVDTIRTKIVSFASTVSFDGNLKIILLDEADFLTANAQATLRAVIEEFSKSTRFILTCNFKHRVIDPILSRCTLFDFSFTSDEKANLGLAFFKRVKAILVEEGIEADPKVVASVVSKYFPDFRKTLNEIQRHSSSGKIDASALVENGTTFTELIESMKQKKFGSVRSWVAKNADVDPSAIFRYFYDSLGDLTPQCTPDVILLIAQYQVYSGQVADQEINTMAFLVEVMQAATWK